MQGEAYFFRRHGRQYRLNVYVLDDAVVVEAPARLTAHPQILNEVIKEWKPPEVSSLAARLEARFNLPSGAVKCRQCSKLEFLDYQRRRRVY